MNSRYFPLLFIVATVYCSGHLQSQVQTPQLSPKCMIEQSVGLSELQIAYSRPSKRERLIFGGLVPYNEIWRLGANKNTTFTTSDDLYFEGDTLPKGTYAMFAIPKKQTWDVLFYTDYSNWGTPDEWEESKVALKTSPIVQSLSKGIETMTISLDQISTKSAVLTICWDRVKVEMPFEMDTRSKVENSIQTVMSGPSANDYYGSAKYYFNEKLDKAKALDWINKAVEIRGASAYWYTKLQAEILAWNGDYKKAIEAAQISMKMAASKGNDDYVRMNEKSIAEWKKMK